MYKGTIRRAQLVSPFGVGAMSVLVDGTSVITGGLDNWFNSDDIDDLDPSEYEERDWRLESRLQVSQFRLPPDFRTPRNDSSDKNVNLTIPVYRFPCWHFCIFCKRLERSTPTMRRAVVCKDLEHKDWKYSPRMSQVPFVTICADGHLGDFPFHEWVHKSASPTCKGENLRLRSVGGNGLEGQKVICEDCNSSRTLRGITSSRSGEQGAERTHLTDQLAEDKEPFLCTGSMPWLGGTTSECSQPVRGALRGAGNVYFPKVESSIYIPSKSGALTSRTHDLMRHSRVKQVLSQAQKIFQAELTVEQVRDTIVEFVGEEILGPVTNEELFAGYQEYFVRHKAESEQAALADPDHLSGIAEWRYPEFLQIRQTPRNDNLTATDPGIPESLEEYLERVRSVDTLRETRALRGFTRVRDANLTLSQGKALLRRDGLSPHQDWLPCYVVNGEGIYIELKNERLQEWENRPEVLARADRISSMYRQLAQQRGMSSRAFSPRMILLHTLSHLLINELVFSSGYSSASIRERLYASEEERTNMNGILLYTAAGDSEGTLGGLVRMARGENLSSVFSAAISNARWCSTDPVCMEGGNTGQGPESCNLAACHACALLPETSCEEANRFLDRGMIIGTFDSPELGFFSSLQ